ncbi:microtubule-associated protein futsch isoform X1 [Ostrinia furnacalis]|uniref:microtubule-associated protein futsch isoform X1 n=1 Tax=Ostrinia furnacalis TaxID=93504 RepID=UPI001039193C|nr:microtubule-associated protein futsch isoform X1 [Ostrinia furnacalis]
MSEGDVSLIRDEDVLRRMWQQTEDFSRKKEIRAHMYRLREERLRNLYSPEPAGDKGCEFTSTQGHVKSFADQSFQSMKSKEVRDAGSPPKEFTYRGQDLKELSNAGWNVESENTTSDDGHTRVRTVAADVAGHYDVPGGRGHFAALDTQRRAHTEYHDDTSSLQRDESSTSTAAREHVVRQTDDGTHVSSSKTSSSSTSKFQQVSSTKLDPVPYLTDDDCDRRQFTRDTNRTEETQRREATNDYEQNLRRSDLETGELVSRKVDYPDDDTKVIVETRRLPDGTRVTSTRREFRAPAHVSRAEHREHRTTSENRSSRTTSQQKSDVRESTSKITRHNVDNDFVDIVDSQKTSDDYDFKRDQRTHYTTTENDTYDSQKRVNKQRLESDVNEIRRDVVTDERSARRPGPQECDQPKSTAERVHHTTRDNKVEEVVERKTSTERYQTTYQTDFSQKKISNDWSPSQQAWASSLRADTPPSTRPSTRASSPGARTFQSSTSSLRSSVSPDKTSRKPPSRGGSPSKVDRHSPTRTVSDRYSSSHSTQSVTESKTHRYTSPEGRPPHGKSPTRPGSSPDRKPQDGSRPRYSVSPDKKPQDYTYRPSASPDRSSPNKTGPADNHPRTASPSRPVGHSMRLSVSPDRKPAPKGQRSSPSPDRKPAFDGTPADSFPRHTSPSKPRDHNDTYSTRPSQSPTRKPGEGTTKSPTKEYSTPTDSTPGYKIPADQYSSPTANFPRSTSPSKLNTRPSSSPERKPAYQKEATPQQPRVSPERKPGYMRPTATTKTSPTTDAPRSAPHKPSASPDRKSPARQSKITKATEDHYTFIDEETKMYTRTGRQDVSVTEKDYGTTDNIHRAHEKVPSPARHSPSGDSRPDTPRSTLRKTSRSPSPPKGPVTFTQDQVDKVTKNSTTEKDVTDFTKYTSYTDDVTTHQQKPTDRDYSSPVKDKPSTIKDSEKSTKDVPSKEGSPSKFGTYDKKQRNSQHNVDEVTQITTEQSRYDSLTRREKSSSPRKVPDVPSSPTKKTPRDSVSPTKSVTKDSKFKHTNEFINVERTTEEINKKTVTKDRPRQLVTPSTSPTRKPKPVETAPSTGQSSPTTSVSGFVYFSSPRPQQTIVTDLDDEDTYVVTSETDEMTTYQRRPDTLEFTRSPSPSKIPCRSPSPEKRGTPTDSLPRKSSLKKPVNYTNRVSPTEKPPSSFQVSPTVETPDHPEHTIVKKDRPEEPRTGEPVAKPKPPLERRETYEERCRKILGMMEDNRNKTATKKTLLLNEPEADTGSPNMSPYLTPSPKDDTPFKYPNQKETKVTEFTQTDFITKEREQIIKDSRPGARKPTSRDSSPTKLQDIFSETKCDTTDTTYDEYHLSTQDTQKTGENKPKVIKPIRSSISPEKRSPRDSPKGEYPSKISQSPERKISHKGSPQKPRTTSPSKPNSRPSKSPERKPSADTTKKPIDKQTREPSPSKRPASPGKQPGYMKPTSATLIRHETYDVEESTTVKETKSDVTDITKHSTTTEDVIKHQRKSTSPDRRSPAKDVRSPTKEPLPNEGVTPTYTKSSHLIKQETYDVVETEEEKDSNVTTVHSRKSMSPTRKPKEPSGIIPKSTHLIKQETYDIEKSEDTKDSKVIRGYPGKSTSPTRKPKEPSGTIPTSTYLVKQDTYNVEESDETHYTKVTQGYPGKTRSPTRKPQDTSEIIPKSSHLIKQETYDVEERDSKTTQVHREKSKSPTRHAKVPSSVAPERQPQEPTHSRTPSPGKKTSKITIDTEDFVISEREQEVLAKVQKSLRKLSPNRSEKSPTRGQSPPKSTTSLKDIDIITEECVDNVQITTHHEDTMDVQTTFKDDDAHAKKTKTDKSKEPTSQKTPSKPSSRNVSPVKKPTTASSPTKGDKAPESPGKSRSISPKKAPSSIERPQSPQVPKASGIKPREPVHSPGSRKPTTNITSPTKADKTIVTTETKKTSGTTSQSSFTKSSTIKTTSKIQTPTKYNEPEPKRAPTPKNSSIIKKDTDAKVTRTTSDLSLKTKKPSPQRMKSKPEIQVNDTPSTKTSKHSPTSRLQKPTISVSQSKLPSKPKSATALNTSTDDDDVIIDVQQAKSSRENSPDRICPTPINFGEEDIGTPRFPDEVNEPDDDFRQRTHHTIHEAESLVDDIVEICEDDELFVKVSDSRITESDECLLSVNDKVTKFTNKIETVNKDKKDATKYFKETEIKVHSDYIDENLKSDECLLSVSEKVNKFAKGPRDTKDSRSPSRKIVDEYDRNTIYQDDYTKLSVNDKAHLFVETAENTKVSKTKPAQKVERPNLNDVDESLKSDDCLLSVSDKVNKFVKTAEQFLTQSQEVEEKEKKIKEQHDLIMRKIVGNIDDDTEETEHSITTADETVVTGDNDNNKDTERNVKTRESGDHKLGSFAKETTSSHAKVKDHSGPNLRPTDKTPTIKITTLRSSEAVKKAKALFENIATTQKTKDTTSKTTKLTDIGVIKKSPKTDSTIVLHPSIEDGFDALDADSEADAAPDAPEVEDRPVGKTPALAPHHARVLDDKPRGSPTRLTTQSPEVPRTRSPMRQSAETTAAGKTATARHPAQRAESPNLRSDAEKTPQDKVPGYQRPTKTSQIKEETKIVEETEASSRRGSGKFGVELRRASAERAPERRRSLDHHQPCIEDIYDLDLLEQMLEKVAGYEQRRRIRAQIRVARKTAETERTHDDSNHLRVTKQSTLRVSHSRSPDRRSYGRSPDRQSKSTPQRTTSPERHPKATPQKASSPDRLAKTAPQKPERSQPRDTSVLLNGHAKEPAKAVGDLTRQRTRSPEKPIPKVATKTRSPVRQPSPEKKTRTTSPSKTAPAKPKSNRFNEYATAYMKKAGMNESDKLKFAEAKTKKADTAARKTVKQAEGIKVTETKHVTSSTLRSHTERTSSKDEIEIVHMNGKRSPSPEKKRSPERQEIQNDRLREKSPSPVIKRQKSDTSKKETIIKTVYEIDKKVPTNTVQEDKPSWVTNRNLKKITSETRTFSSKKIEAEKPKYRATSPSKVISKPIDVITSSYGPGPLDSDGKPLFGIKALRNGASNVQVKGTVIRQEFHSRNGSSPEGSVSVTAYSSSPDALERLLRAQGERPSRLHGLAAITTTKRFGGDTGASYHDVHTKEERAALDQFTHSDRRVIDSRVVDISDVTSAAHDRLGSEDRMIEDRQERATDKRVTEEKQDRLTNRYTTEGRQNRMTSKTESRQERIASDRHQTEGRKERITVERQAPEGREERITEVRQERVESKEERPRVQRTEDRHERTERVQRREDKKTVRQSSVKSLTEKYIKSASEPRSERSAYPKAGLILRTAGMKDSVSSDSSTHAGLARTDSEHSLGSVEDSTVVSSTTDRDGRVTTTTTTRRVVPSHHSTTSHRSVSHHATTHQAGQERSFLDSSTKVTGVQDILTRMKNADIVIQEGDSSEDSEARALLNKFLGATVLMSGMQAYVTERPGGKLSVKQETVRSSGGKVSSTRSVEEFDLEQCWDERVLRKLLDECTDYEQRRRIRARIRNLMAEQEACASAVTEALAAAGEPADGDAREEEEVTTVTSSVRRDSSEKTVSSSTTTKSSKVIESMSRPAPKPVSPFAKFRQLEKQNSTNSPNSPKTPQSPGSPSQPYFKFTDPALQASALTIKERLLQWCRDKTRDYENVKLENFSTSWADGLAFCALLHHFLPDAFDYAALTPDKRRHNFTLAFKIADEKAGIYPLLDVDDMVAMRKPDWKCVFTYVQAIHRRFKDHN